MKAGEKLPTKKNVGVEKTSLGREVTEQPSSEPRVMEGVAVPETARESEGREEWQASLPLVLVLFEAVLKEEPRAKRLQALSAE